MCDVGLSLPQLHREIERQLPSLHSALVATGYSVLDANGWPVGRDQEMFFSLAEVLVNRTVRLRVTSQQSPETLMSAVVKVTPTALPSSSRPSLGTIASDPAHSLHPIIEETVDTMESSLLSQSLSSDAYASALSTLPAPGTVLCMCVFCVCVYRGIITSTVYVGPVVL